MNKLSVLAPICLLLIYAAPSLWAQDEDQLQQISRELPKLFEKKDWDGALKACDKLIELKPGSQDGHYNRACCLARLGKKDEALAALAKSVELGFKDAGHIAEDPDLESLHAEQRFKDVLDALEKNRALNAVCFVDAQNGWAVGERGLCLATNDGGTTWQKRETGSSATLRDVRFKDAQHGWICGDGDRAAPECRFGHILVGIKNTCGTILTTEDGGRTWINGWVSSAFELPAVEVSAAPVLQLGVGGSHGHIDGDILRSNDGGKTWGGERSFRGLFDIRAIDGKRWVAVGSCVMVGFRPSPTSPLYLERNCRALFSKDGGNSWTPSKGSDGRNILRRVAVKAGLPLIAVGDKGAILISEDAGENWQVIDSGTQEDLRAVAYSASNEKLAVAVGTKGTTLFTADGGKNWSALAASSTASLQGVCAKGDGFIAVGDAGTILWLDSKTMAKK